MSNSDTDDFGFSFSTDGDTGFFSTDTTTPTLVFLINSFDIVKFSMTVLEFRTDSIRFGEALVSDKHILCSLSFFLSGDVFLSFFVCSFAHLEEYES